jgi:hypothetical protein
LLDICQLIVLDQMLALLLCCCPASWHLHITAVLVVLH